MHEPGIRFTDFNTLLYFLPETALTDSFSLAPTYESGGKLFERKQEFHITLIGSELGKELLDILHTDREKLDQLAGWLASADWTYELTKQVYFIMKDKLRRDENGSYILRAESIVLMIELPAMELLYAELEHIFGRALPVPPAHITLYTYNDPYGIGIPSRDALHRYMAGSIGWKQILHDHQ